MPFPENWPPPAAPGRGPSLRFYAAGTATGAFSGTAYVFAQQAAANPLLPRPIVLPTYVPSPFTLPDAGITADVDAVHGPVEESASNTFPGPFTNPDVPRNLTVTFDAGWEGGNVTVVGTDYAGLTISETFVAVADTTVVGALRFKTVVSATKTTVAGNTDLGATDYATIGVGTYTYQVSVIPRNPAATVTASGYLWCSSIRICNDEAPAGTSLEYSFDGTNVHGKVLAGTQQLCRKRYEAGISLRGVAAFRVEAW